MNKDIQYKDMSSLFMGTGEFNFCEGARTVEEAGALGYLDLGNIKAHGIEAESEKKEHTGAYRGGLRVDKVKSIKTKFGYVLTLEEIRDVALLLAFYGVKTDGHTQAAVGAIAGRPIGAAGADGAPDRFAKANLWYDVLAADGSQLRQLASATVDGQAEGKDFILDRALGRIRFLADQTAVITPTVSAPEITVGSARYMEALTPLVNTTRSGIGRLTLFDEDGEKTRVRFDHFGFGCDITLEGKPELSQDDWSSLQLRVQVTTPTGQIAHLPGNRK